MTVASYAAAVSSPGGGTYIIAWGAVLYGLRRILRGLPASPAGAASELLNAAAQLEGVDRSQAIAKYEEIIQRFPGTSASQEAARNIQTLSPVRIPDLLDA
ncbi:MAG: hypothetical protein C5B50_06855 [Verrucomicrobia bacterium]|nr:MAG: hypothetical protein C5B50_06855 [Verrucomicrobiota bacterium]